MSSRQTLETDKEKSNHEEIETSTDFKDFNKSEKGTLDNLNEKGP